MNSSKENFFHGYGGTAPENYEKYFVPAIGGPLAKELIEKASIQQGEHVMDVACGTGIVARLAAERVGKSGRVVGVDMNPGMLGVARTAAAEKPIEWYEANAENLPLPDESFNVVLCQLGLQFFQDPLKGLREMRRVLRPEGRVLVRTVGPTPELFKIMEDALSRYVSPQASAFVQKVFSLYDKEEIHRLLDTAGFQDLSIRHETKTLRLPPPEDFFWQYIYSTPLSASLTQIDDDQRSALRNEVVGKWQQFVENRSIVLNIPDVLATAAAPKVPSSV